MFATVVVVVGIRNEAGGESVDGGRAEEAVEEVSEWVRERVLEDLDGVGDGAECLEVKNLDFWRSEEERGGEEEDTGVEQEEQDYIRLNRGIVLWCSTKRLKLTENFGWLLSLLLTGNTSFSVWLS